MIKFVRRFIKSGYDYVNDHPFRSVFILIVATLIIIPFIVLILLKVLSFGIFETGTNDGWIGFWGGYLGAIVAIGGVYWQVTRTERKEKQRSKKRARPLFYFSYRRSLNEGEKVYYNASADQWISVSEATVDPHMVFVEGEKEPLRFDTHIRYNPRLLVVQNVSNQDAYFCSIHLSYYFGDELDKEIWERKNFAKLNEEKLKNEVHHEHIEFPVLNAKESAIIVIWPILLHRFARIKSLTMTYVTAHGEKGTAILGLKDIKDGGDIQQIPEYAYTDEQPDETYFSEKQSYTVFSVVSDFLEKDDLNSGENYVLRFNGKGKRILESKDDNG